MKKSKILVIALIVLLVALGAGAVLVFGDNVGLDVHWTSGFVNVEYHTGGEITISETGNRAITGDDELRWWLDGGTLRIQYAKSGRIRLFDNLKKTLTISLPEGTVLKSAVLHLTSGDVNIPKLTADETILELTSGDIDAALDTKKLKANATSGNMDLRLQGETEEVTIGVTSGKINVDLGNAKKVSVMSTSGDIQVSGAAGNAELGATSGKINVRFSAFDSLKIDVTSGDVKAWLPEDPGFRCEVSKTSGFQERSVLCSQR